MPWKWTSPLMMPLAICSKRTSTLRDKQHSNMTPRSKLIGTTNAGWSAMAVLVVVAALSIGRDDAALGAPTAGDEEQEEQSSSQNELVVGSLSDAQRTTQTDNNGAPLVTFSELRLRSIIESTNGDLQELKRDFMRQMTDIYLCLKLDLDLGFEVAREGKPTISSANMLLAAEFADLLMTKYVVERRLLTGLKLANTKFLPMQTLVRLYQKYRHAFGWLKDQKQVDLRPKFQSATENQLANLYSLIELRARLRAADDVLALTTENILRVLQTVELFLVAEKKVFAHDEFTKSQLEALARNSRLVLRHYQEQILEPKQRLLAKYELLLEQMKPLIELVDSQQQQQNGEHEDNKQPSSSAFFSFVDRLTNTEALDLDLNHAANSLEFPPTISEQIVQKQRARWIPSYVAQSLQEDRKLLLKNRKHILKVVELDQQTLDGADVSGWLNYQLGHICRSF